MRLTAERSAANPRYFLIRLNGVLWRVCHEANLTDRWPGIEVVTS